MRGSNLVPPPAGCTAYLDGIRLQRFRSLQDTGLIRLRPLMLLIGQNSSGKSSFLRFFPLIRQTEAANAASPLLWFGEDVDLGDFSRVCMRGAASRSIQVDLRFALRKHRSPEDVPDFSLLVSSTLEERGAQTVVTRCQVEIADLSYQLSFGNDGVLMSARMGEEELLGAPVRAWAGEPISLVPSLSLILGPNADMDVPELSALRRWLELAERGFVRLADSTHYSGPVRQGPARFYRKQELRSSQMDPAGANMAAFLLHLERSEQDAFSRWAHEHFGFEVRIRAEGTLNYEIEIIEKGQAYNLIDMGYGFSQVLPLIIQSWASAQRGRPRTPTVLAVEQPELHLHPRYQALLADMLVDLLAGLQGTASDAPPRILVETHSEALINRIGELIANGRLAPRDVLVLLFEKDGGISRVREAEFTQEGFLRDWPIGFFAP